MRGKVAKKLRRVATVEGKLDEKRYKTLKRDYYKSKDTVG